MTQHEYSHSSQLYVSHAATRGDALRLELALLSQQAEIERPGSIAGYVLVSADEFSIEGAVFPSLPRQFQQAVSGIALSLPFAGTCAEAICSGVAVTSCDIASDRYDPNWSRLCIDHGMRSLQSIPFKIKNGRCLGTFVLGFSQPSEPGRWNKHFMQKYADLAVAMFALKHLPAASR